MVVSEKVVSEKVASEKVVSEKADSFSECYICYQLAPGRYCSKCGTVHRSHPPDLPGEKPCKGHKHRHRHQDGCKDSVFEFGLFKAQKQGIGGYRVYPEDRSKDFYLGCFAMKVQRGRNKDGSLKEKRKMEIYKCRLREEAEILDKFKNMDHVVQIVEHFAVSFKDDASGIQRYVWTHNLCLQILYLWLVIVMRKMEPLTQYLRYQLPCCDDDLFVDVTRKIVGQIRKGLQTIHSKKMIHRDIKPANVLLTLNGETNTPVSVVIADFGIPCSMNHRMACSNEEKSASGCSGTPGYWAPEVKRCKTDPSQRYDESADVFSLGMTMAAVCLKAWASKSSTFSMARTASSSSSATSSSFASTATWNRRTIANTTAGLRKILVEDRKIDGSVKSELERHGWMFEDNENNLLSCMLLDIRIAIVSRKLASIPTSETTLTTRVEEQYKRWQEFTRVKSSSKNGYKTRSGGDAGESSNVWGKLRLPPLTEEDETELDNQEEKKTEQTLKFENFERGGRPVACYTTIRHGDQAKDAYRRIVYYLEKKLAKGHYRPSRLQNFSTSIEGPEILVTFEIMENEEEDQELEGDVAAIITVFNAGEDVDEAIIEFRNIGPNENAFIHFFEAFKRRKIVGL
eukprot:jgi/Bigna1/86626/estExt_fgenesh1_pg.C_120099